MLEGDHRGTGVTLTSGGLVTLASSANTDAATERGRFGLAGCDRDDRRGGRDHPRERDQPGAAPAGDTVTREGAHRLGDRDRQRRRHHLDLRRAGDGGAGGGKISVAGSLGLAVINQTTTAEVAGTVVLTGGDATITAASNAASTVKAEPTAGGVTATRSVSAHPSP